MDFRISRAARERYAFDESLFSTRGEVVLADPAAARRFAMRMVLSGGSRPERPVHAGDIDAIGLIHEMQHRALARVAPGGTSPFTEALTRLRGELGADGLDSALAAFEDAFPTPAVHAGLDPRRYLEGSTDGRPNRDVALEEMLLVWVANQNPAFMVYSDLFDPRPLAETPFTTIVERIRGISRSRTEGGAAARDVVEELLLPMRAAPGSLSGQLRWIRDNWGDIVGGDLQRRLTLSLDILAEEETSERLAWERHAGDAGAGATAATGLQTFGSDDVEAQRFSPDRDWMPSVVLMAKSTYVWIDQLSRRYSRHIGSLDGIPDEELDRLRDAGVTGLWLIGLWERSHASQEIKQLRGNADAVASAYSLMDYRIAEDLGGESAYENLRDRAWARGIRLASDMVPNHMGIDSRWVIDNPGLFLQRADPAYPAYTFNGPNLSQDERVAISIEDHYFDNSDAAVVFRRRDMWSGEDRFIYHGNDGTSFPWNDTAQLDYLNAETREAVIQTILAVARRFPIIRFDAAMTLARRHVQRLWYPLPGQGGAIPSRAEYAMTQDEFDRRMPNEFWREVVDRVAQEAPDTLLLAEAFWMLEGYFVRTLGMHRVYNSAFMHMLRDERNAEYRVVIRETLDFDPEILKRYVNFMNNPDERTAIDQFGDGDKYFGVATMLATLPGLPMLGHGQIEGFGEKYGMEFRRATLHEEPKQWLVERHEREIFPLLRQRWRFAEAKDFRLYDFVTEGGVDENVFAYSNGWGDERSVVVFQNRYAESQGSVAGIGEGMGIADDGNRWLILRDARSGLEFLRNAHDLRTRGLELTLHAYQCYTFLWLEEVVDAQDHEWSRLAWRIGLAGVPDVRAALTDQRLEPLTAAVGAFVTADVMRTIAGAGLTTSSAAAATLDAVRAQVRSRLLDVADTMPAGAPADQVAVASARLDAQLDGLLAAARPADRRRSEAPGASAEEPFTLRHWLGTDRTRWGVLIGWILSDTVLSLAATDPGEAARAFDGWNVNRALGDALRGVGLDDARVWRAVELVRALLAAPRPVPDATHAASYPAELLAIPEARAAAGWNEFQGDEFVNREAYGELLNTLAARDAVADPAAVPSAFATARRIFDAAARDGFRTTRRVKAVRAGAEASPVTAGGAPAERAAAPDGSEQIEEEQRP